MSTVVIRKGLMKLSEDARRRAREHLKSVGIDVERLQPLIWPEDAVSAYRPHRYAPWEFTTKADILRQRRERMEHHLWWKREYGITQRRALYVWVFWCPGINDFFFKGWHIYLIGNGGISEGVNLRGDKRIGSRILELFPLVEPTLCDFLEDWRLVKKWKAEFVKRYQRGIWCGKPQGKAPIWAEVKGSRIVKILDRAEWPNGNAEVNK